MNTFFGWTPISLTAHIDLRVQVLFLMVSWCENYTLHFSLRPHSLLTTVTLLLPGTNNFWWLVGAKNTIRNIAIPLTTTGYSMLHKKKIEMTILIQLDR